VLFLSPIIYASIVSYLITVTNPPLASFSFVLFIVLNPISAKNSVHLFFHFFTSVNTIMSIFSLVNIFISLCIFPSFVARPATFYVTILIFLAVSTFVGGITLYISFFSSISICLHISFTS